MRPLFLELLKYFLFLVRSSVVQWRLRMNAMHIQKVWLVIFDAWQVFRFSTVPSGMLITSLALFYVHEQFYMLFWLAFHAVTSDLTSFYFASFFGVYTWFLRARTQQEPNIFESQGGDEQKKLKSHSKILQQSKVYRCHLSK